MHELSIASAILERVEAESLRHPESTFRKVGVRVGELSGVDPDALAFGFEALIKDTSWERLILEIEYCPRRQLCPGCNSEFQATDMITACPRCGENKTTCIAGEELDLAFIEAEGT